MQASKNSANILKPVLAVIVGAITSIQLAAFSFADVRVYQDMRDDVAVIESEITAIQREPNPEPERVQYAGLGRVVVNGVAIQERAGEAPQASVPAAPQQAPAAPVETEKDDPPKTQATSPPAASALAQSSSNSGSSGSSQSSGVPGTQTSTGNSSEPSKSTEENGAASGTTVYVSNRSDTIHSIPNCSNMKNYREMSKSEADANGYDYCKNCW